MPRPKSGKPTVENIIPLTFTDVQPPFDYQADTLARKRKYNALKACLPQVTLPIPDPLHEEEINDSLRLGEDLMSHILLGACMLVHPLDLADWLNTLLLVSKDFFAMIKSKKFRQALTQIIRINEMLEDNFEASDYFNYTIALRNTSDPKQEENLWFARSPSDPKIFFPGWNTNGEIIIPNVLRSFEPPPARKNPQLISQFHKMKQMIENVLERNKTFSTKMLSQPVYWFPFFWQKTSLLLTIPGESITQEEEAHKIHLEGLKRHALNIHAKKVKPELQDETRSKDERTTSLHEAQGEQDHDKNYDKNQTQYRITDTKHKNFLDFMMQAVLYCMSGNAQINALAGTYPLMQFLVDIFIDIFGEKNSRWATCDTKTNNPYHFIVGDTPTAVIGVFFFAIK